MPKFVRVKLDESGHEVTVASVRDGMTLIDKPATDGIGRPLPAKFHTSVDEIRGKELDKALEDAGLSKTGTADEKRARLAEHQSSTAVSGDGTATTTIGGESATSQEGSK